jgi:hypothetical protein
MYDLSSPEEIKTSKKYIQIENRILYLTFKKLTIIFKKSRMYFARN